jgi:transcriptional regulator with XRE-family HTH domain
MAPFSSKEEDNMANNDSNINHEIPNESEIISADIQSEIEFLGVKIKELRNAKGWTLKALAEHSKLNINTLSMIETGKTSPSIYTLQQLAKALNVPLVDFFKDSENTSPVVLIHHDQRPESICCQALIQNLGGGLKKSTIEPFIISLPLNSSSGGRNIIHRGYEFVYCLSGKITYWIQDIDYTLTAGDSLLFSAEKTHRWANSNDGESQFILILTPQLEHMEQGSSHFQHP